MSKQYGILVDIGSCLGCGVCVLACKQENDLPPHLDDMPGTTGLAWNQVLSILEGVYPELSMCYLHLHCMHCENPPCIESCPKDAIYKREDRVVLIAKGQCDACKGEPDGIKKCILACPYGALQFNDRKGVVEGCSLCVHRLDAGLEPACVRACIGGALTFGDFNDPNSKVSKKANAAGDNVFVLKPEKGANPSVRCIRSQGVSLDRVSCLDKAEVMYGFEKQE